MSHAFSLSRINHTECYPPTFKAGFTEALSSWFMRTDFDSFSVKELHAEAAFAELLMMRAMLSLIEEETLMSLVRGMLKIRSANQIIK